MVRGVDPTFARVVFSPLNLLVGSLATLALSAYGLTEPGRAAIGLDGSAPLALLATWPLTYGYAVAKGRAFVDEPRLEGLRVFTMGHAVAATMALAAASRAPFSPFWAAPFLILPCWAQAFPGPRYTALALAALPLRWLLASEPTPGSLAFAGGVSVLCGALHAALAAKRRWEAARAARRDAITALGAESAEGAAAMATAMDLHDGLSGLVLLCRARARAGALRETEQLVRESRAFLATFGGGAPRDAVALRRLAATLGVELTLAERGEAVPRELRAQALALAGELVANEARHGSEKRLTLDLDATPRALRLSAQGSPFRAASGGRGLANLSRRVAALGGRVRTDHARGAAVFDLTLPRPERSVWISLWALELVVHLLPAVIVWRTSRSLAAAAVVAAAAAGVAALQIANAQRAGRSLSRREAARRDQVALASAPHRRMAVQALDRAIVAVEQACDEQALKLAIEELGAVLAELLAKLEAARRLDPTPRRGSSTEEPALERREHGARAAAHV